MNKVGADAEEDVKLRSSKEDRLILSSLLLVQNQNGNYLNHSDLRYPV